MDRPGLEAGERCELLLRVAEHRERLGAPCGEDFPGLGQPAAAAASLDEALAGRGLEKPQVLARARLADADGLGGAGQTSAAPDLHDQAHARRVPQAGQHAGGAIGIDDGGHSQIRLAQWYVRA